MLQLNLTLPSFGSSLVRSNLCHPSPGQHLISSGQMEGLFNTTFYKHSPHGSQRGQLFYWLHSYIKSNSLPNHYTDSAFWPPWLRSQLIPLTLSSPARNSFCSYPSSNSGCSCLRVWCGLCLHFFQTSAQLPLSKTLLCLKGRVEEKGRDEGKQEESR